ncbi:MAG: serine/threonine protein kinase, partial [Proteobacteria bacterium]|nr:serine/threonine protein kinase [Pseudomonadota bacterium]
MNIELWKQANQIYTDLLHLSVSDAVDALNEIKKINPDVKQIVVSLINSGNLSSLYFKEHVSSKFDVGNRCFNPWKAGQKIGNYELIKEIGEGGMSKVFSGKRINSDVQKLVAIKIFSPNNGALELREHFLAEQKILSGLTHPNIITMHHGETTEKGDSFIVMELVDQAVALDDYVKSKKLSTTEKITMILDVANALAYAHANLIIHRDVKPSNIIVGNDAVLKVVDFGIAKLIEQNVEHDNATIMALTPSYASPEQINAQKITVTTDIFSLAVVCMALITAQSPLPKDRLIKSCQGDEEYLLNSFKKHVFDKDLRNILNQALQQDPVKRYSNMHKFAEDLQAWLNKEPVSATPDSWAYRVNRFAKRRRALFASITTLIFTLTIAVVLLSWQYNKIKIEAQKAQQVKQFMLDSFKVTDPNTSEGIEISAKDLLKVAADKLNDNNKLNPQIKFELYQTLGIAYGQLGFLQKGIDLLNNSLLIKPKDTRSLSFVSQYLFNSGQQHKLKKLLETINEGEFNSEIDRAVIYRVRAKIFAESGHYDQALEIVTQLDEMSQNP